MFFYPGPIISSFVACMPFVLAHVQRNNGPGNTFVTCENPPDTNIFQNSNRVTWMCEPQFVLTLIGYNIGIGNLWRFPFLCMRNGGGAFLIPYFFFLIVCGIPLLYLEVAVGQFSSRSAICVWGAVPLMKGLGWGMIALSTIVTIYYNVLIVWVLFYLARSIKAGLYLDECDNVWNSPACHISRYPTTNTTNTTANYQNDVSSYWNWLVSPVNEYWRFEALQETDGSYGRWQLFLCLLAAWSIVFLCLCKGIRSSGIVIFITATLPYLLFAVLIIRAGTLPGAMEGIQFFIIPDLNKLANFQIWGDACLMAFYTLGPCWGGLVTMASYNKFHYGCLRDTIISSIVCCATALSAGFFCFSLMGFLAPKANVEISELVVSGPGYIFTTYQAAFAEMPISGMYASIFFFLVYFIGLDTQFVMVETVVTSLVDRFPKYLKNRKTKFTACVCLVEFLLGIPLLITQGGIYLFQILYWYSASFSFIIIGLLETIALSYIYGLSRLESDIQMMAGHGVCILWKISWAIVTPVCLLGLLIYTIFAWHSPVYGDYRYPSWAIALGWLIAVFPIVPIPVVAVLEVIKEKGSLRQRIKKLLLPADGWGPARQENRMSFAKQEDYIQDVHLATL